MTHLSWSSRWVVDPAVLLSVWTLCALAYATVAQYNSVTILIGPGAKEARCGYYDVDFRVFASAKANYFYVTDTACSESTATPCLPPTNALLVPISCTNVYTCARQTSQPSAIPLCVVAQNNNFTTSLAVELLISGSTVPPDTFNTDSGGGGLSTLEIVLISISSFLGLLIVVAVVWLTVWLLCFKKPAGAQVSPYPPATAAAKDTRLAPTIVPIAHPMYPPVMGGSVVLVPQLMGPANAYTYPNPYRPQYPPGLGMTYYGGPRSPSALAPLPPEAYRTPTSAAEPAAALPQPSPPLPPPPSQKAPPQEAAGPPAETKQPSESQPVTKEQQGTPAPPAPASPLPPPHMEQPPAPLPGQLAT